MITAGVGVENSVLGGSAGIAITSGRGNVLFGYAGDGVIVTTGANNATLGWLNAQLMTTGSHNVLLGWRAGENITTAMRNALVGPGAGSGITTGTDNILIGENFDRSTCPTGLAGTVAIGGDLDCSTLTDGIIVLADGNNNRRLSFTNAGVATFHNYTSAGCHEVNGSGVLSSTGSACGSGGAGDVTAASTFGTDNRIIRSDGTGKGVQASAVTLDDSGNMTGVAGLVAAGNLTVNGDVQAATVSGSQVATAAQQETATNAVNVITPSVQQRHPSAAKAWFNCTLSAGSYNISGGTCNMTATGQLAPSVTTAFSSENFACAAAAQFSNQIVAASGAGGSGTQIFVSIRATADGSAADGDVSVVCFGNQ